MSEPKFTHNGWMLFCSIKITEPFSSAELAVAARWLALEPLLSFATFVQGIVIGLCSMVNPEYKPAFYFRITGERKEPIGD